MIGSPEAEGNWNNDDEESDKFFVGYVQLFRKRTGTTLKDSTLLVYIGHVV